MKFKIIMICAMALIIILIPIFFNIFIISPRISYFIEYDIQASNREEIINAVEMFDYSYYLNNYHEPFYGLKGFIDAELVSYLKSSIENDTSFHWELLYEHHLRYFFGANNHSYLYLTYNNDTIFNVRNQQNNTLLSSEEYSWEQIAWFLNFSELSPVYSANETVVLNNSIFVELNLDYGYYCGSLCGLEYVISQYLILNNKLEIIMIFIPPISGYVS